MTGAKKKLSFKKERHTSFMLLIILSAVLVLLAVLFFFWVIRAMLRAACPQCLSEGDSEMVIPLLPGWRWFCPACGGSFRNKEVLEAGAALQKEEDEK